MRFTRLPVLLGVVAVAGCLVIAPPRAVGLEKGMWEIAPALAFSYSDVSAKHANDVGISMLEIGGQVGYCFTQMFEIVGGPMATNYSVIDDEPYSGTGIGLQGGLKLNFGASEKVIPYVYAGAGFVSFSGDIYEDAELQLTAPAVRAGLRLMAGRAGGVDIFGGYNRISNYEGVKDLSSSQFVFGVGMTLFPGRE